jgi:hypothetical protein
MTYRQDFTLPAELMEQVAAQGLDVLPELIRIVVNAAMQAERSEHIRAEHYQHTPEQICWIFLAFRYAVAGGTVSTTAYCQLEFSFAR